MANYQFDGDRNKAIDVLVKFISDSICEGAFATEEDWSNALEELLKEHEAES
jgi:hypothetical protein